MDHHQLFSQESELYAKVRPQYPKYLFKYLAECCQQQDTAWDGACGNGQAAIGLAGYFNEVYATDISEQQIANAIQKSKVTYTVQPSESTNFCQNQFDIVCIAQALHWFDYDLFWPEVKRVLKPGGVFAAWGYSWFSIDEQIDDCIQEKFLNYLEPYWAAQNKLLWDLNQLFGYLRSWSSTRRWLDDSGESLFLKAYDVTKAAWGDENIKKLVDMDFCLLVGRNET